MSLPPLLVDFSAGLQARFGGDAAGCTDDGVFAVVGQTEVNVFFDKSANRAVALSEIEHPTQADPDAVAQAAVRLTGRCFLENGMTVAFDRDQDMAVIGRSFDTQALELDDGIDIVGEIAEEAPVAGRHLAAAVLPAAGFAAPEILSGAAEAGRPVGPDPRFADFIAKCTGVLGLPDPAIENDSYMFSVGDRWVELKFSADRETVTTAAVVSTFSALDPLRADLVASFNLHNLLDGGCALVAEQDSGVLRLCRMDRLAALRPQEIHQELVGFAQRTAMTGTWYLRTSAAGGDKIADPPAQMTDYLVFT